MTNLRKLARDQDCKIRIPGECNGNPETTVLCHLPGGGMGKKQRDLFGAHGCSGCHDAVDGRTKTPYTRTTLDLWMHHGVIRTIDWLIAEDHIHV